MALKSSSHFDFKQGDMHIGDWRARGARQVIDSDRRWPQQGFNPRHRRLRIGPPSRACRGWRGRRGRLLVHFKTRLAARRGLAIFKFELIPQRFARLGGFAFVKTRAGDGARFNERRQGVEDVTGAGACLLYTSDAADE